ncbi:MAG: hypothetical protein AMS26_05425 [Bacteroides sp. SM23_62]|nr:MAG: hypothetical protein AMS26_05425 [Bacteroides sp. SM23_62]
MKYKTKNTRIMKQRNLITVLAMLGVFIFIDPSTLAQSTGILPDEEHKAAMIRQAEKAHQEAITRERARARSARDDYVYVTGWGSGERNSSLMLSKRYNGQSIDKQGTFEVDDNIKKLKLSIDGEVNSGSITVSLILPDGKPYKSLTMDDTADIHWSESLSIKDGEKKYYGTWRYRITTKVADGSYHLSINTY